MSKTRKIQAANWLAFLIIIALFGVAPAPAQVTPKASRGKHNGKIVFTSDRNYKGLSIWTMNPDGSSPTRLTDDKTRTEKLPNFSPVYDSYPVWSPDGKKIAFVSNRNYHSSLYVMNADGSDAQLVTDKVIDLSEPAWSPDGEKIAFTGGARGTFGFTRPSVDIYVINVDGGGLAKLTNTGMNASPTWSPDRKQIAFSSYRDTDNQAKIWVMNADGSNQRMLLNSQNTGIHGGDPAWSPDGTKILFTAYRMCGAGASGGIYVMSSDGSNGRLLTTDPKTCGRYAAPRWSPDGARILANFSPETKTALEPATQIIVMNADGSNPINISNRGKYYFNSGQSSFTDVHADWQPLASPPDFESSVVGFSAPSYTAHDDVKSFPITVTRTGNLTDVASCFYVVLGDTGILYGQPPVTGTLRFARGESSKTISLPVSNFGGNLKWSLKIILSDNDGNASFLGGIKEAAVTILPRNYASRQTNPN